MEVNILIDKKAIRLEKDMKLITSTILDNFEKIETILLYGGYGRDEGAWIYMETGEVVPYNDYDILVISENRPSISKINLIREELAKKIGIRWVDIDFMTMNHVMRMKNTIKNIDIIYGSKIIYGNSDVFEASPNLNPQKIGFYDIEQLYFTRMWTLFGSWDGLFRDLGKNEAIFFRNQMAKAILAAVDVLLIKKNQYNYSYVKRIQLFKDGIQSDAKVYKYAEWALSEKLSPSNDDLTEIEMRNIYNDVYKIYREAMMNAMGWKWIFFGKPYLTRFYFYLNPYYFTRLIYRRYLNRSKVLSNRIKVKLAENFLFVAYYDGFNKEKYLKKVKLYLNKLGYDLDIEMEWNELRQIIARVRNEV